MKQDALPKQYCHEVGYISACYHVDGGARSLSHEQAEITVFPDFSLIELRLSGQNLHVREAWQTFPTSADGSELLVCLVENQEVEVEIQKTHTPLHAGDILLCRATTDLCLEGSGAALKCLLIPDIDLKDPILADLPEEGLVLPGNLGMTCMLHHQILGFHASRHMLLEREARALLQPLLMLLKEGVQCIDGVTCASQSSELDRLKGFIQDHLTLPELSVDMIAKNLGLSRAKLYRLAEPLGGIQRFITKQRLKMAHTRLLHTKDRLSITNLAFDLGFNTETSFRRSFKERYGVTPTNLR